MNTFVFDPLTQGLELLSRRELQEAEFLFLSVINDPYAEGNDSSLARRLLGDIRSCLAGTKTLDFDHYSKLARSQTRTLENIVQMFSGLYFLPETSYADIDRAIARRMPAVVGRLKQIKIRDVVARDAFLASLERRGVKVINEELARRDGAAQDGCSGCRNFDILRWKTVFRKFVEAVNPILLERHLELLEYVLETGDIAILGDKKLTVLTPKYRWIIESTLKSRWFLLRSYFFKARSEIQAQFKKKEGTRKFWEEMKSQKIKIFEKCGFSERHIQKFLYSDKLNYKTLEEIYVYAAGLGLKLAPRDVSLALRGVNKARDHIKERGGQLTGARREFQERLTALGFSGESSYRVARHAKTAHGAQIADSFAQALQVARQEISWYRILPSAENLRRDLERQCCRHLSTVRIHLFERGRLNKLLLQSGKTLIRNYLIKTYGEKVVGLHCYFRLETIHQYYKLKYFQYHGERIPSVSELIKISREDFSALMLDGYKAFLRRKRLVIDSGIRERLAQHVSVTQWEDPLTAVEEKILLRFWFLRDHGVPVTQGLIGKGVLSPDYDLLSLLDPQLAECNS